MIDWTFSLDLNAASGLVLVAVAGFTAFRKGSTQRSGLLLFLLTWGLQLALTNFATRVSSDRNAFLLAWLSECLVPVQALMMLYYTAQTAKGHNESGIYAICRRVAFGVIAMTMLGFLVALAYPSKVLTVQTTDGFHFLNFGAWEAYLFSAPQLVGVTLGLVLLANLTINHRQGNEWTLLAVLALAWGYSAAYNAVSETDPVASTTLWIAVLGSAILVPAMLGINAWRTSHAWRILPLLALPIAVSMAWLLPHQSAWSASGTWRLLASPLLGLTLWRVSQPRDLPAWSQRMAASLAAACLLAATVLLGVAASYAVGLALAGFILIALLDGSELHRLLLPPDAPSLPVRVEAEH